VKSHDLHINNLSCGYDSEIVHAGNLTFKAGRLSAIFGANGSGKSTFLKTLGIGHKALGGEATYGSADLLRISPAARAQLVGYLPPESPRHSGLTGLRAVAMGRLPHMSPFARLSPEDTEKVRQAIERTDSQKLIDKPLSQMSDGERQRIMLARLLAQDTPILLPDEPFAFLDIRAKAEIHRLIASIAHDDGKMVIMSTHELSIADPPADCCYLIENGQLVERTPAEIMEYFGLSRI
jgi:iron complex transport system ATP-binding protein